MVPVSEQSSSADGQATSGRVRHHRPDVVAHAIEVLDAYGLGDLTMRRIARELDVQPSALYHHFPDKQTLLAAVADEVLVRGSRSRPAGLAWDEEIKAICGTLRDAMLAYRDGAELVATTVALGLGAQRPGQELRDVLAAAGAGEHLASVGSRALLHYVFGHVVDEQTHLQAAGIGAIDDGLPEASDFELGLRLLLDGLEAALGVPATR